MAVVRLSPSSGDNGDNISQLWEGPALCLHPSPGCESSEPPSYLWKQKRYRSLLFAMGVLIRHSHLCGRHIPLPPAEMVIDNDTPSRTTCWLSPMQAGPSPILLSALFITGIKGGEKSTTF